MLALLHAPSIPRFVGNLSFSPVLDEVLSSVVINRLREDGTLQKFCVRRKNLTRHNMNPITVPFGMRARGAFDLVGLDSESLQHSSDSLVLASSDERIIWLAKSKRDTVLPVESPA